jgi:hypothetical protein
MSHPCIVATSRPFPENTPSEPRTERVCERSKRRALGPLTPLADSLVCGSGRASFGTAASIEDPSSEA